MPDTDETTPEVKHPVKPREAREQATEYLGFMGSEVYDLGGGDTWELPNPQLMPPDMEARYNEHLRFMTEDLDTDNRKDPITGEERPVQKFPLRHKGELINDKELLAVALMGDATYKKFLKAGGVPGQIATAWQMMNRQFQERLKQDSKSR
ncbi:hypothetical protein AB0876_28685 [Mycobacterium sp. NPDC049093]